MLFFLPHFSQCLSSFHWVFKPFTFKGTILKLHCNSITISSVQSLRHCYGQRAQSSLCSIFHSGLGGALFVGFRVSDFASFVFEGQSHLAC